MGTDAQGKALRFLPSALLGYVCGTAWFAGNCYWIYQTMFVYGGLPAPVSFAILILFSLYLGLYFAVFGGCFALLRAWKGRGAALAFSPLLWVAVELARARITGFPWDLLGYTQINDFFLTKLAPWTGVMGLSLVVAFGNTLWLFPQIIKGRWRRAGPMFATVLMGVSYIGSTYHPPASPQTVAAILLQDNLKVGAEARGPQEGQPEMLASFAALTLHPEVTQDVRKLALPPLASAPERARPEIVACPEAPTDFTRGDPRFRDAIAGVARAAQAPVVADALGFSEQANREGRYDEFASASFFLPDGSYAGRYDKMHLVPFGEYTPYKQLFFFAGHLLDQLVFVPGTQRRLFSVNGHRFGVFICYESIFGDEVREFSQMGAQVLVNLSDDGWYGDTSAPWEHLVMARMRAIENRRWLLRDTNTGVTGSIDPEGRIVAQMPRHMRGALEVPFSFREDTTFYTRHGDWIGWLCALVVCSVLGGSALQRRYPVRRA